MILRSDVHSLFDRGLVGVEPEDYSVVMSDVLANSSYSDYNQLRIRLLESKISDQVQKRCGRTSKSMIYSPSGEAHTILN